jgi:hypothetical protein
MALKKVILDRKKLLRKNSMPYKEPIIAADSKEIQEQLKKIEKAKTLVEIILAAWELAIRIVVKIVEMVLEKRAQECCKWPLCPKCGARIENKARLKRQIKSIIGVIRWKRKVGRCPNGCEIGQIAPLDKELGLQPNQRVSNELKRAACALAVFVPYQIAAVLLKLLTGVHLSPWSIWLWVQEIGAKAKKKLEEELADLQKGQEPPGEFLPHEISMLPMVIGADGVTVPFRPHVGSPAGKTKYKEIKIGIITRIKRFFNRRGEKVLKIERKRLVAVRGNTAQLRARIRLEALKQGISDASCVIWISDGARGLWRIFRETLAHCARGILDFYHAAQNIWKGSSAWLDGRTKKARRWFKRLRHLLRYGTPSDVINEINKPLRKRNLSEDARNSLRKLHSYFLTHYEHIDYVHYKELDLPIGSGMVESACKWLVQQRFKCVGMRWSDNGFDHLLLLRLAWVNGRFNELFFTPP